MRIYQLKEEEKDSMLREKERTIEACLSIVISREGGRRRRLLLPEREGVKKEGRSACPIKKPLFSRYCVDVGQMMVYPGGGGHLSAS